MKPKHLDSILRQTYGRPAALSASHQEQLEARLTAQFMRLPQYREKRALPGRRPLARMSVGALLVCLAALAAAQVPAQYAVKVGELVRITVGPGDSLPQRQVLLPMLQQAGATQSMVRTQHTTAGDVLIAQVWGRRLAEDLPERLSAVFPRAQVSVSPLKGTLQGTLLDKIRYELLDLSDPQKIAQARAALVKQLAAQGVSATVDISVSDVDGRPQPRVMVRVPDHGTE